MDFWLLDRCIQKVNLKLAVSLVTEFLQPLEQTGFGVDTTKILVEMEKSTWAQYPWDFIHRRVKCVLAEQFRAANHESIRFFDHKNLFSGDRLFILIWDYP